MLHMWTAGTYKTGHMLTPGSTEAKPRPLPFVVRICDLDHTQGGLYEQYTSCTMYGQDKAYSGKTEEANQAGGVGLT